MNRNKRIITSFIIIFTLLLFIFPHSSISSNYGSTVIGMLAFLFGILAGFYIVVTTTDYNAVKNLMATEAAGWISLYENLTLLNKQRAKHLSTLIDSYVIQSFNYELYEYTLATEKEFIACTELVRNLSQPAQKAYAYEKIQSTADDLIRNRQQMTVLSTKTLSPFSWLALITLGTFLITSLYGLRTGELFFDIIAVGISTSVVIILLLIRDLDLYRWNEHTYGYIIDENILKGVGQLPYYPAESLTKGRIKPTESTFRLGTLTNYPKSFKRKITIVKQ